MGHTLRKLIDFRWRRWDDLLLPISFDFQLETGCQEIRGAVRSGHGEYKDRCGWIESVGVRDESMRMFQCTREMYENGDEGDAEVEPKIALSGRSGWL